MRNEMSKLWNKSAKELLPIQKIAWSEHHKLDNNISVDAVNAYLRHYLNRPARKKRCFFRHLKVW
jgi:hypothetical protein